MKIENVEKMEKFREKKMLKKKQKAAINAILLKSIRICEW